MKNYYIDKDGKGNIVSAFSRPQERDKPQKCLKEDDSKVKAFLNARGEATSQFGKDVKSP